MSEKILITGASGFIGKCFQQILREEGMPFATLTRTAGDSGVGSYHWDINKAEIDAEALAGAKNIVHFAGAGIADKRWTKNRKKEIIDSRVRSANLLFSTLQKMYHQQNDSENSSRIRTFISASAVGIYGNCGDEWVSEEHALGDDFLADTCRQWEAVAMRMKDLGVRVVIFRIGIVLGKGGGALPLLARPVRLYGGMPLGSGRQYISWIHVYDLCKLLLYAIKEPSLQGIYNAVAPDPVTNKDLMKLIGKILHRPVWNFNIPSSLLKLVLGEKSLMALEGQRASNKKILAAGFQFRYDKIEDALVNAFGG